MQRLSGLEYESATRAVSITVIQREIWPPAALQSSSTVSAPASLVSAGGTDLTDNVPDALYDIYKNANNFGAGKPNLPASLLSLDLVGCKASPSAIQGAVASNPTAVAGAKAIQTLCYTEGAGPHSWKWRSATD